MLHLLAWSLDCSGIHVDVDMMIYSRSNASRRVSAQVLETWIRLRVNGGEGRVVLAARDFQVPFSYVEILFDLDCMLGQQMVHI
jgi:hypothetical protein